MTTVEVDVVRDFLVRDEELSASLIPPRVRVRLGHWFRPALWPVSVVYFGLRVKPRRVAPKPSVSFIFKQAAWLVRADVDVSWGGEPSGEEFEQLLRGHIESLLLAMAAELELPSPPALDGSGRIELRTSALKPRFEWVVQGKRFVPVESTKGAIDLWRFFPGGIDHPVEHFLDTFNSLEIGEQDRVAAAVCAEVDAYFEALAGKSEEGASCLTDSEADHAAALLCGGPAIWEAVLEEPLRYRDASCEREDDSPGDIIDAVRWG